MASRNAICMCVIKSTFKDKLFKSNLMRLVLEDNADNEMERWLT